MGNRAVICLSEDGKYSEDAPGIYLHWNGGRDSVEAFLDATKKVMEGRGEDFSYSNARLVQVIGIFMGGNLSLGLDLCRRLDTNNFDNGVYVVDASLNITERKFFDGAEQQSHNNDEFVGEIMEVLGAADKTRAELSAAS